MEIESIEISRFREHPDNPNRMSKENFRKLKRHIEMSGRYEPIVVRKVGEEFQIINGHHRVKALTELGYKEADCVVWDVTDQETDILLMTLNRLGGRDVLEKKSEILKRLSEKMELKELSKRLASNARQIEATTRLKLPKILKEVQIEKLSPMVFFLKEDQRAIVAKAIGGKNADEKGKGLVRVCEKYLNENSEFQI